MINVHYQLLDHPSVVQLKMVHKVFRSKLHYEAERIIVDDDDSTEFFGQARKIFHMLCVLPEIVHPNYIRKRTGSLF